MSMYTKVSIELEVNDIIKEDLDVLIEMSNPHCTTDGQFRVEQGKLILQRTYNHGHKKALLLLKELERYISTNETKEIGSFSSEDIGVDFGSVYTINNKLYITKKEHIDGCMYQDVSYTAWNTDGKRKEFMKSDFLDGDNVLTQGVLKHFSDVTSH